MTRSSLRMLRRVARCTSTDCVFRCARSLSHPPPQAGRQAAAARQTAAGNQSQECGARPAAPPPAAAPLRSGRLGGMMPIAARRKAPCRRLPDGYPRVCVVPLAPNGPPGRRAGRRLPGSAALPSSRPPAFPPSPRGMRRARAARRRDRSGAGGGEGAGLAAGDILQALPPVAADAASGTGAASAARPCVGVGGERRRSARTLASHTRAAPRRAAPRREPRFIADTAGGGGA